jgi:hypothetical protein
MKRAFFGLFFSLTFECIYIWTNPYRQRQRRRKSNGARFFVCPSTNTILVLLFVCCGETVILRQVAKMTHFFYVQQEQQERQKRQEQQEQQEQQERQE